MTKEYATEKIGRVEVISEAEMANILGYQNILCLRARIYERSGKVPPHKKMGRRRVFPVAEFEKWLSRKPLEVGIE